MEQLRSGEHVRSLRWRLFRVVCAAAFLLWAASGVISYLQARHEAEEMMDGHLALSARLLLALVRDNEHHLDDLEQRMAEMHREQRALHDKQDMIYQPPLEFQVGLADGTILLRSADAPELPILGAPGYMEIERGEKAWRLFNIVAAKDGYRVQVAQSVRMRERAALEVATQTVLPIGIVLPLLLLLLYWSIRRGLKPLDDLAADVASRSPDNLSILPGRPVPLETRPLVEAINRLLSRLSAALDSERRFTADAAHELRTPLAAVKIQAEVALASRDSPAREHALQQIRLAVDRSSHLVDQLLRLARLDPLAALPDPKPVDLVELAEEAVAAAQDIERGQQHVIRLEAPTQPVEITGDRDLLFVAVRNLLDNALRHTPPHGSITLRIAQDSRGATLSVRDNGPGVATDELPRLAERFYRGRDATAEGSGLGLAIVQRIAELHGAQLALANANEGGFIASLVWQIDCGS